PLTGCVRRAGGWGTPVTMTESQPETPPGKHAAPDDDPNSDPPPIAGEGGEHAADDAGEESDGEPALGSTNPPGADPEDEAEIEEERQERVDPENRPDNVEVDNTDRDFDPE